MNIGDRLRQLRGEARPESDDALATRLQRLRPPARHATMDPDDCSVLGTALAAEQTTDGLLIRERHYRLSPASCVGVDPSALPETCRLPPLDWLYIDTETTGLSSGVGNLAFMIGVARFSATDQLEVRLALTDTRPTAALMSYTVDLVTLLGTTNAFIGFTSGTGAAGAYHDIRRWVFTGEFNPIVDPDDPVDPGTVPEPGSLALLSLGLLGAFVGLRSRALAT